MTARTGTLASEGQSGGRFMHRVWQSSSAFFSLISNKILGIKQAPIEQNESGRRAQKALDSAKIEIKLLSAEGNLPALRQLAETTTESEISSYAVSFLLEHDENVVLPILQ